MGSKLNQKTRTIRLAGLGVLCALGALAVPGTAAAVPPDPPVITSTVPATGAPDGVAPEPSNNRKPKVIGTLSGDPAVSVTIYNDALCTTPAMGGLGTGTAANFTGGGITLTTDVANNAETTLYATATNAGMETSACSAAAFSYFADASPPGTTIDTGPTAGSVNSGRTFTFTFTSASSYAPVNLRQCTVDAAGAVSNFQPCTSPFTTPELADGSWNFRVRSRDSAGNTGSTTSRQFAVDNLATPTIAPDPTGRLKKCKKKKKGKKSAVAAQKKKKKCPKKKKKK